MSQSGRRGGAGGSGRTKKRALLADSSYSLRVGAALLLLMLGRLLVGGCALVLLLVGVVHTALDLGEASAGAARRVVPGGNV